MMRNSIPNVFAFLFVFLLSCTKESIRIDPYAGYERALDYCPLDGGNVWYYSRYSFVNQDTTLNYFIDVRLNRSGVLSYFMRNQPDSIGYIYAYSIERHEILAGGGVYLSTKYLSKTNKERFLLRGDSTYRNYIYGGTTDVSGTLGIQPCIRTRHEFYGNFPDTICTDRYFAKYYGLYKQVVGTLYHSQLIKGNIMSLDSVSFYP